MSEKIISKLEAILEDLKEQFEKDEIPSIKVTARTPKNIVYDENEKTWVFGNRVTQKLLNTTGGSRQILRIINLILYIIEQKKSSRYSTLRELYYVALNWHHQAQFETIDGSNRCIEDLEVIIDHLREEMGFIPEERGSVFGDLVVKTKTRKGWKEIHCSNDVNQAGLSIPVKIEDLEILKINAKFAMCIQTGGMFQRLIGEQYDSDASCIFIHTAGVPSRSTRMFIKKLSKKIPICSFMDGDVWGLFIHEIIRAGAIKSLHVNKSLCTPGIIRIGLRPTQITEFNLPTDKITDREKERIEQLLSDPRYKEEQDLRKELEHMKSTGLKAEQQSLAKYGLNFVTKVYLPLILKRHNLI